MSGWKKLASAAAASGGGLNVEDLFSSTPYVGNGTANTTITNNIDLSNEGGMVWLKNRSSNSPWYLVDTERGAGNVLRTNLLNSAYTDTSVISAFTSSGFTLGSDGDANGSSSKFASWTFRKAPKFFDIVEYTGNSSNNRTIAHNLGSVPGMIIVKRKNANDSYWAVYHRGAFLGVNPQNYFGRWNGPSDFATYASDAGYWNNTQPTSTHFSVGGPSGSSYNTNGSGGEFIAYLFAHNDGDGDFGPTGDQDIIKCGYYTGGAATNVTVDLGFEPQFLMIKASSQADWVVFDQMRGIGWPYYQDARLRPSNTGGESDLEYLRINPDGFTLDANTNEANGYQDKYMYVAIRRGPMAVPENVDDVFAIDAGNTSGSIGFTSGFPVDMAFERDVTGAENTDIGSRLFGTYRFQTNLANASSSDGSWKWDFTDGWFNGSMYSTDVKSWMWKRAPNFFDIVCYRGTDSVHTLDHNLGVAPEMMWIKADNASRNWFVYHKDVGITKYLELDNDTGEQSFSTWANSTAPTDTQFTVNTSFGNLNNSSYNYSAYLFATLSGVSKVGSYTGTGSALNVDCGFSNGAQFVLIKNISSSGNNWVYFDTLRGIVSGNDPKLELNNTAAQQTGYDWIDPYSSGFTINPLSGYVNSSGNTYIFYAIAA